MIAPHDLRRTCARICHQAGGELEQIPFLLGHVSIQTTQRYLRCKQRFRDAVHDHIGLDTDAPSCSALREWYALADFPVLIRTMPNWIVGSEEAVANITERSRLWSFRLIRRRKSFLREICYIESGISAHMMITGFRGSQHSGRGTIRQTNAAQNKLHT